MVSGWGEWHGIGYRSYSMSAKLRPWTVRLVRVETGALDCASMLTTAASYVNMSGRLPTSVVTVMSGVLKAP